MLRTARRLVYFAVFFAVGFAGIGRGEKTAFAGTSFLREDAHLTIVSGAEIMPLVPALQEYSRQNDMATTINFTPSNYRLEDIAEGDMADLIVASHPIWNQKLKQMGLLDVYSIANFVEDALVVVAAAGKEAIAIKKTLLGLDYPTAINELAQKRDIFAVVRPDVTSLGIYSAEALQAVQRALGYDVSPFAEPQAVALNDRGLPEAQASRRNLHSSGDTSKSSALFASHLVHVATQGDVVKHVAAKKGVGLMYKSAAERRRDVDVIYAVPRDAHEPIIYQLAVIAGEQMAEARKLENFLLSAEAAAFFVPKGYKAGDGLTRTQ
ncbi:MAG: substrate-binding domain-containing protein [Rickettsiales bacterium]